MSETTIAPATPPAPSGGTIIDYDKLAKALAPELAKLAPSPAPAPATPAAPAATQVKPLTAEDIEAIFDRKQTAAQTANNKKAARATFADTKMKDLPSIYRDRLPDTDDQASLIAAEQTIREQYKVDFAAAGGAVAPITGAVPGGAAPSQVVDTSKLSGYDLISLAVKNSTPITVAPATAAPVAAAPATPATVPATAATVPVAPAKV